jgi:hypothetical protein
VKLPLILLSANAESIILQVPDVIISYDNITEKLLICKGEVIVTQQWNQQTMAFFKGSERSSVWCLESKLKTDYEKP